MTYIGTEPAAAYTTPTKQTITGTGVATYTLDYNVASEHDIQVFLNNVRQEGGTGKAYTVSDNQITFASNIASTDELYVLFTGKAIQTIVAPDLSITTGMIKDDAVTAAKVDSTLHLSTIKDSTGTNNALTIDSTGRVLQPKKPSFLCRPSAAMSQATAGWRTLDFATVDHDIGSNLHADGYFVAPVDGVYHFNYGARLDAVGSGFVIIALAHNNTGTAPLASALYYSTYFLIGSPNSSYDSLTTATTIELSANDKVVPWAYAQDTSWTVAGASSFSGHFIG